MCFVSCILPQLTSPLHVCVFVGNAASVAGLKGRVKAAQDKTKELLKALNGSKETLNAIPSGTCMQKPQPGQRVWLKMCACVCVRGRARKMKTGWINTRSGSAWRVSATRTWTQKSAAIGRRSVRPQPLPKLPLDENSWKQQENQMQRL